MNSGQMANLALNLSASSETSSAQLSTRADSRSATSAYESGRTFIPDLEASINSGHFSNNNHGSKISKREPFDIERRSTNGGPNNGTDYYTCNCCGYNCNCDCCCCFCCQCADCNFDDCNCCCCFCCQCLNCNFNDCNCLDCNCCQCNCYNCNYGCCGCMCNCSNCECDCNCDSRRPCGDCINAIISCCTCCV